MRRRSFHFMLALLLSLLILGSALPAAADGIAAAITLVPETTVIGIRYVPMTLTGTVTDAQGNPLAGIPVQFTSSNPSMGVVTPRDVVTDADGSYTATYTSQTRPGSVYVWASVPGTSISSSVIITQIMVGAPDNLTLTTENPFPAPGGTIAITGRVTDVAGSPNGNVAVALSATAGDLSSSAVTTKADGTFIAYYTAPTEWGSVVITATAEDYVSNSLTVNIWPGTPASVSLVPESTVIGNRVSMSLSGKVTDSQGNGLAGIPVQLGVSPSYFGWIRPSQVVTDADGSYTATFTGGSRMGLFSITAAVPGTAVSTSVAIEQVLVGEPANLTMTPADLFPMRGGTILITGKVTDEFGHPNANVTVMLSATSGTFASPVVRTRADGSFRAYFMAPDQVRELTVTARLDPYDLSTSVKLHVMPNDHPDHPDHP